MICKNDWTKLMSLLATLSLNLIRYPVCCIRKTMLSGQTFSQNELRCQTVKFNYRYVQDLKICWSIFIISWATSFDKYKKLLNN